jgi:hypothetical protein
MEAMQDFQTNMALKKDTSYSAKSVQTARLRFQEYYLLQHSSSAS